jgi:hypothetical protein
MSRMPSPPERSDFTDPGDLAKFDKMVATRAKQMQADPKTFKVDSYYGSILNSPPYGEAQNRAAYALRSVGNREGSYSHADREWVDQVLSMEFDTYKVLQSHTRDAISVGVRLEAIEALWEGRENDLTEDELLLTRFIRQVATGTVDDETWNRMLDRLGKRGLVEYVAFIGHLIVVLRMFQAFDVPSKLNSREDMMALLKGIRDGSVEIPDKITAVRVGG